MIWNLETFYLLCQTIYSCPFVFLNIKVMQCTRRRKTRTKSSPSTNWWIAVHCTSVKLLVLDNGCRIMPYVLVTLFDHKIVLCCVLHVFIGERKNWITIIALLIGNYIKFKENPKYFLSSNNLIMGLEYRWNLLHMHDNSCDPSLFAGQRLSVTQKIKTTSHAPAWCNTV